MVFGFKGFNKSLCCLDHQFEIGKTYEKFPIKGLAPRICTPDGFHFCKELEDVFIYYNKDLFRKNRFCIVVGHGPITTSGGKCATFKITILKEITDLVHKGNEEEIRKVYEQEIKLFAESPSFRFRQQQKLEEEALLKKKLIEEIKKEEEEKIKERDKLFAENLSLKEVAIIQKEFPHFIVGGSVSLFLHGVRLNRWENCSSDIDIITPYYTLISSSPSTPDLSWAVEDAVDRGKSGDGKGICDFEQTQQLEVNSKWLTLDIRIDNKQKYEIVEYEGIKYKCTPLRDIWEAKIRYNSKKHNDDLVEVCNFRKK